MDDFSFSKKSKIFSSKNDGIKELTPKEEKNKKIKREEEKIT